MKPPWKNQGNQPKNMKSRETTLKTKETNQKIWNYIEKPGTQYITTVMDNTREEVYKEEVVKEEQGKEEEDEKEVV